jgi:uncharacterized damage-inducible protein DinB
MTLLLALLLTAGVPLDQTAPSTANPTIASIKGMSDVVKGYLTKAAGQVAEEHYAFKPTPDVRSMGEIFAHVADANFMICGMASGQKPTMSDIEKTKKTKAEITSALDASFAFCESAMQGLTDARANETVKFFIPGTFSRLGVLAFNVAHDFEHYGNIVTYMRMKGMVPPSSARGM